MYSQALKSGLEEVEIQYKMDFNVLKQLEISEYSTSNIKRFNTIEQGQDNLPGKLVNKIRKQFLIVESSNKEIIAESLSIYTKDGFLINSPRNAIFYGKTAQSEFPFTISLISDSNTRIMSGKSTRKNYFLDIKGDSLLYNSQRKNYTETGFSLYYKNNLIALFNTTNPPSVFIKPNIYNADLKKVIVMTILFLSTYERSSQYPIL